LATTCVLVRFEDAGGALVAVAGGRVGRGVNVGVDGTAVDVAVTELVGDGELVEVAVAVGDAVPVAEGESVGVAVGGSGVADAVGTTVSVTDAVGVARAKKANADGPAPRPGMNCAAATSRGKISNPSKRLLRRTRGLLGAGEIAELRNECGVPRVRRHRCPARRPRNQVMGREARRAL
jgi:hypothetical protein